MKFETRIIFARFSSKKKATFRSNHLVFNGSLVMGFFSQAIKKHRLPDNRLQNDMISTRSRPVTKVLKLLCCKIKAIDKHKEHIAHLRYQYTRTSSLTKKTHLCFKNYAEFFEKLKHHTQ